MNGAHKWMATQWERPPRSISDQILDVDCSSFKGASFFFFFSPDAGHVGEAGPNAHCPLTRKLVTSPLKAGRVILAIADMHTDVWNPSGQCFHCS